MTALPFTRGDLEEVRRPLAEARTLPASAYLDPSVLDLELRTIFGRDWLAVGRLDDVARPGQWFLAPVTPEGVLVVCGLDNVPRAFANVCRHRGTPLVVERTGAVECFVCPYHGWTYDLEGGLVSPPVRGQGLFPVRIEEWQSFLFVTLDPEAPALRDYLSPLPPHLERVRLSQLQRGRSVEYEVAANWKLLVENFQESHHFSLVHPELEALTPWKKSTSFGTEGPWLGGTMDMIENVETVAIDGARSGRPYLVGLQGDDTKRVYDCFLWPNLLTSVQPDYLLTYQLWPVEPRKTRVVADIYFHPAAFAPGVEHENVYAIWDIINPQDRAICERQQIGIASRAWERGRYAESEDGMHAFDLRLVERYLAEMGPPDGA